MVNLRSHLPITCDELTNVRVYETCHRGWSTQWLTLGDTDPERYQGREGSSSTKMTPNSHARSLCYDIPPREMRERFCGGHATILLLCSAEHSCPAKTRTKKKPTATRNNMRFNFPTKYHSPEKTHSPDTVGTTTGAYDISREHYKVSRETTSP